MKDKYEIKLLNENDLNLIKSLFIDVFTNEPWNDDWSNENQLNHYLLDIIGNRNSLSIGLISNNELLGISLGSIIHWYTGTEYYIREFCIQRSYQHQGIGSIFLNHIEKHLSGIQIKSIILSTDSDTPAYSFYIKNDFSELTKSRFFHKSV